MRRLWLFLACATAWTGVPPAGAQDYQGQVYASPLPKVRVVRPTSPDDATTGQTAPSTSTTVPQTPGTTADDGTDDQPRVVRLMAPEDSRSKEPNTGEAGDGSWRNDRDQRFKKAPEPSPSFKPDEGPPPIVPIRTPSTGLKRGARLRQLDKMTGQIQTYDVAVGETVRIARLQVRLDACRSPRDNETHGTMAFLKIWDTKRELGEPDFSGWMFAESPALSALDHPRYDVWVINCTTPLGE